MREIAAQVGVAPITVSRAISRPEMVSTETRMRVMAVVDRLGFVPSLVAGSMSAARSRIVAVVVPTLTSPANAEIVQGLSDVLGPQGYQLLLGISHFSLRLEEDLVVALLGWRPSGLVLTGLTHTPLARRKLKASGVPVIEATGLRRHPIGIAVGFSNFDAGYAMTAHLAARGYRVIAFCSPEAPKDERHRQRHSGYRAAVRGLGLPDDPGLCIGGEMSPGFGREAIVRLRERRPEIDAVFFASDLQALGAIQECHRRGWKIPTDVGIAGFGDQEISSDIYPSLTTVRVPRYQIGQVAAERILARIADRDDGPNNVDLGFEILQRESA